jgi:outer membrane protein
MKKSVLSLYLIAAGTLLLSNVAMAQYTVQLGLANVDPNSQAGTAAGPLTPPNALSFTVKPQSTVFFSIAREINDDWDVQLALGYPPTHDVDLKIVNASGLLPSLVAQNGVLVAQVRQVAPTLFANYKFGDANSKFRPFIGVGVNYTNFDQTSSTAAGNALNGGATNIKLSDSWGTAMQAGAVYKVDSKWSLSGTYSTANVNSVITTNTLGVITKTDISFRPAVFILAVGYSF